MRNAWVVLVLLSCGAPSLNDAGADDGGLHDSGVVVDAGFADSGFVDAGLPDAGTFDAGVVDAGGFDAGAPDAGRVDAGVPDAGGFDAGFPDAGGVDAGVPDAGAFDAGTPTLNGGDLCAMAPDVTAGGTFRGTTVGALDQYGIGLTTNCPSGGAASGNDVAYLLNPIIATTYTVTVTPLNQQFDPLLYVQSVCGSGPCLAGTTLNGAGQPESVTFTVSGGTSAYIVVDGELGSSGSFEISIVPQ